ncbi:hypothetical protein [Hymenobacter guriensis]|uniref:DUF1579 domain-containing protein n=1 Tax=Hymenobacter guriensis TaxID=2793065 RepID=A0ABS0L4R5_9BACT|nr:hypothetical protein [Hymenobacter guriensis]MBG8555131.1 hypothetical protein [Hymenobacter guriensis]
MRILFLVLAALLFALPSWAQSAAPTAAARLQPFLFLEGDWQGEGWIQLGPSKKSEFVQTETVRRKLGGSILTIEGLGVDKANPQRTIHNAFATIAYDAVSGTYRMRAYRADGAYTDALATLNADGSMTWGFEFPAAGKVRFTIRLNEQGQWHEKGEFSRDGAQWYQNFEMTLRKVSK